MQFVCRVTQAGPYHWVATYEGTDLGAVSVTAPSREQALEKMRQEILYRLELCPCTGERHRDVEIELWRGP